MRRRYSGMSGVAWATALVVAGFGILAVAWRGTAGTLFVPTQTAFLVSGAVTGLGLIGAGAALLNIQVARLLRANERHSLDRLVDASAATLQQLREVSQPVDRRSDGPKR